MADDERIFAAASSIERGVMSGANRSRAAFERDVEALWGRPVIWVESGPIAPSGHCDVFLMPAGARTVVLGDAEQAAALLGRVSAAEKEQFVERFRALTRNAPDPDTPTLDHGHVLAYLAQDGCAPYRLAGLQALGRQLEQAHYRAVHVPFLTLEPDRMGVWFTITYTNVIMDVRGAKRTVYLPVYGLEALDDAAAKAWRGLGYDVVRIDAFGPAIHGGSLRCLSQVTRG